MRLVCFSDTHGSHEEVSLPPGDVLIFAGDCCNYGTLPELTGFITWFSLQASKYRRAIFVAGNHDWPLENMRRDAEYLITSHGIVYLRDQWIEVESRRFYGSPWVPQFNNWAFNVERGSLEMKKYRSAIPAGLDVLITHCPPYGILDKILPHGESRGCAQLRERLDIARPVVHIFGDIHEAHGHEILTHEGGKQLTTNCYNVSVMNRNYDVVNPPTVVDI